MITKPPTRSRKKLGVDIDPKLKKRLNMESAETDLSLKKIIDVRLRESYRSMPTIPIDPAQVA